MKHIRRARSGSNSTCRSLQPGSGCLSLVIRSIAAICAVAPTCVPVSADPVPAPLFQNGLVVQRQMAVRVWGKADPGERITVEFKGSKTETTADASGKWSLELPAMEADKTAAPLWIRGKSTVRIDDVLVGEVFLAGGQSNMEVPLKEALNPEQEAASAHYPFIREFKVEHDWATAPVDSLRGKWTTVSPQTAPNTGAVGLYFAGELQKRLDVPVGIINNAYSASPAEAWVPVEVLEAKPSLYTNLIRDNRRFTAMGKAEILRTREELGNSFRHKDPGNQGESLGYARRHVDDAGWKALKVPGYLETVYGEVDGAFWLRRTVELPAEYAATNLTLELGAVDDTDITYFNGVQVGATPAEGTNWWETPRVYTIPASLVVTGRNVIAVRCFDEAHAGGLTGPRILLRRDGGSAIDLAGDWQIKDEAILKPLPWPPLYLPLVKIYRVGGFLYNAMLAPLAPCTVRGVIWYQGESNADRSAQYRTLFKDLIGAWRMALRNDDLPFLFVQLAAFGEASDDPNKASNWAALREAQEAALELPHTYMVPAIDIGDARRIHPLNKQEVGRRLGLTALRDIFHDTSVAVSFPAFDTLELKDGKAIVSFKNAEGLKTANGKDITAFAVCGADGKYEWAKATIADAKVILSCEKVPAPVAVRYAWGDNPTVNLVDAHGFPVLPFRTDRSK